MQDMAPCYCYDAHHMAAAYCQPGGSTGDADGSITAAKTIQGLHAAQIYLAKDDCSRQNSISNEFNRLLTFEIADVVSETWYF